MAEAGKEKREWFVEVKSGIFKETITEIVHVAGRYGTDRRCGE